MSGIGQVMNVVPTSIESLGGTRDFLLEPPLLFDDFMKYVGSGIQDSPSYATSMEVIRDAKNLTGVPFAIIAARDFAKHSWEAVNGGANHPAYSVAEAIGDAGWFTKASTEVVTLMNDRDIVALDDSTMQTVSTVGSGALLTAGLIGAGTSIADIAIAGQRSEDRRLTANERADEVVRGGHAWINLVKNISYVALGALALAATIWGVAVAPWVTLAVATAALFLTMGVYFHDQLRGYTPRPT